MSKVVFIAFASTDRSYSIKDTEQDVARGPTAVWRAVQIVVPHRLARKAARTTVELLDDADYDPADPDAPPPPAAILLPDHPKL